ncbi:MAG TPA: beta-galactosidase [Micromonosporaceae bacterium]|jgi:beta-galactosidase
MLFGAAYYPEYQPYERLERDIALMRDAGIGYVRLGESTWASWEPSDGRFEFAAMDKAIDAFADAGIGVILGTPTYAIPPWLYRAYPEIMVIRAGGAAVPYGGRQNVDITHAAYRFHAERVIRALVGRYAEHPALIGFQVDNEAGLELAHNRATVEHFHDWLRARYGSVEAVNEAWGLTYWSHRLGSWEDLWPPDGNTNPGYALAWRRFQAQLVTEFLAWQAGIVREYARADQFVTHCLAGGHGRPAADRYAIGQVVDIAAENVYHPMQDGLALPAMPGAPPAAPDWADAASGPASLYFQADVGRSASPRGFLVTETNASSIGGAHTVFPAYDGQWRLAAYALIARGASGVGYWHWHTIHFGHEMYWGGILGHDLEPGRCYREVARIGAELRGLDDALTGLTPDADVALLYSVESGWALEFQPPLAVPGTARPDDGAYRRIVDAFYRALFDARRQVSIVHAAAVTAETLAAYRMVVVPSLYVADDALLGRLAAYARAGGHLVVSFRTGYADEHGRARWARAPGPLREAVGASYHEYSALGGPVGVRTPSGSPLAVPPGAQAHGWADGLLLEGAEALAYYDHPHLGRFPVITSHRYGEGRVTYVGTLPDPALGAALARWAATAAGLVTAWPDLPESVRVTGAHTATGQRVWFVSNWSWQPTTIFVPHPVRDLHSAAATPAGAELALGAWDVRLLQHLT